MVSAMNIFLLGFTVAVYFAARWLYARYPVALLSPIIVSALLVISLIKIIGCSVEQYSAATKVLNFMLAPTVVTLGWALYRQIEHLRQHLISILISIFAGCVVSIVSVIVVARLFGVDLVVEASMLPKSVTIPIALEVSRSVEGLGPLTIVMVVFTGIYGSVVAPFVLRAARVTDPVARGLAIGAAAHAVGTAKAMEMGAVEGALGALAIALMGLATALLTNLILTIVSIL
ncbi:MAG: LrgB family protein [Rikenellaceae bacterium]